MGLSPDRTLGTAFQTRHGLTLSDAIKARWLQLSATHRIVIHHDSTAGVYPDPDGEHTTHATARKIKRGY